MAKIENMPGASVHLVEQAPGFGGDSFWCCAEQERVKVSLHRDLGRQLPRSLGQTYIPVHSQHLRAALDQVIPVSMGSLGKNNHGHPALQTRDDLLYPTAGSGRKIALGEDPAQAV